MTGRIVGKIKEDDNIPIARGWRAVICGGCTTVVLCWMWISSLAK